MVLSFQVAILVILKDKQTEQEICVCTTHLKARSGALLSALRNEQGKDLLEFVAQHSGGRPIVLSGDFNAEPSEPIYSTVLSHDLLQLCSAYSQPSGEPPYTTWKIRYLPTAGSDSACLFSGGCSRLHFWEAI